MWQSEKVLYLGYSCKALANLCCKSVISVTVGKSYLLTAGFMASFFPPAKCSNWHMMVDTTYDRRKACCLYVCLSHWMGARMEMGEEITGCWEKYEPWLEIRLDHVSKSISKHFISLAKQLCCICAWQLNHQPLYRAKFESALWRCPAAKIEVYLGQISWKPGKAQVECKLHLQLEENGSKTSWH